MTTLSEHFPKSNRTIDASNTHIHDRSLSWFDTATSKKVAGLNYVYEPIHLHFSEMKRSCKCLTRVSKMPTLTYTSLLE